MSSPSFMLQFWACGGAITILVFNGVVEAHSAVLLPQLQEAYSPIRVDKDEETWIGRYSLSSLVIFNRYLLALNVTRLKKSRRLDLQRSVLLSSYMLSHCSLLSCKLNVTNSLN